MATAFDRWEKDPFFYAAEEVQESADRLESVYRQWIIHQKKPTGGFADSPVTELRRELSTALGTAKWQLEELERAVRSSDHSLSAGESTVTRHTDFIVAISSKISIVENALKELNQEEVGRCDLAWIRLDEGERDELALFLSPPKTETEVVVSEPSVCFHDSGSRMNGETSVCFSTSNDSSPPEMKVENRNGHRRVASSCSDLGLWKISVSSERSLRKEPALPISRILSLSELKTMEASSKPKWYRYGFRKWKVVSHENLEEKLPLRNHQLRGMGACYEKSKSCLTDCNDESYYSKQLHGWFGALQRRIQRSQYQIQYGRPTLIIVWTFATVLLVVILVLRVS